MTQLNPEAKNALVQERTTIERRYAEHREAKRSLDMTRGKPCSEQLDLSSGMLTVLSAADYKSAAGVDCRNYGVLDGLPEAKELLGPLLGVAASEVIVGGNSSLTLMHDTVAHALSHGVAGGNGSWQSQGGVKFLCPSPGYDRHFALCEHLGIELITVDLFEDGPDMDTVERRVAEDPLIKGIWLVPRFSNPTGYSLSSNAVSRLARMPAAPDFRIFWDNAYSVHTLTSDAPDVDNILDACKRAGTPDRPFLFGSTSKISFAGAGVAVMGGSEANMAWMQNHLSFSTIGADKLNQLRHVRFFGDFNGVVQHMTRHAAIIKPKFDACERVLSNALGNLKIASWTRPLGGYFISFDTQDGCAKRVVELAATAGVKLTGAGATFPYKKDPRDRNIRIAPTLPNLAEIEAAMEVFSVCVKLATLEKLS